MALDPARHTTATHPRGGCMSRVSMGATPARKPRDMKTAADFELCRMAGRNVSGALEEIMLRYEVRITRFAIWYVGNVADVADIDQETFIRVHKYAKKFDPKRGNFSGWIHMMAQQLCL